MLFSTMHQGLLFLWMMAGGALIWLWYLLVCGLRKLIQAGFVLTLACDLLFGAGTAILLIAFLVAGNYGTFRPFALLGAALGFVLCAFATLAPLRNAGRRMSSWGKRFVTALEKNRLLKVIFK